MAWCIPKHLVDKFLQGLKDGSINPERLAELSSEERRAELSGYVGEANAKEVNANFESKLLLKNQQAGLVTWAKQVAGLKPEVRNDLVTRIEKMSEVLSPKNEKAFLEDLAEHKLGTAVTMAEAADIASMSKVATEARDVMEKSVRREFGKAATEQELKYGNAYVALNNYVKGISGKSEKMSLGDILTNPGEALVKLAGQTKSMKASMDNSAIFRQGWKTLWTNPGIWAKNAGQSFLDIAQSLRGKQVLDGVNADIVSRPNYELYRKARLNVGTTEEAFPEPIFGKVPVLKQLYNASESAFTGFVHRQRADVFDTYIEIAKKSGVDINNKVEIESIGKMVNSLTGRGELGKLEGAANVVNNVFFSPRFLKSQFDVLTAHRFQKGATSFVKKQAAINLLKIAAGSASILAIAKAINPDSVETDARSSNFGKIKVGNRTFDVTGGMGSLVVFGTRLLSAIAASTINENIGITKSATTGIVKRRGDFGVTDGMDIVQNFAENKLSPLAGVMRDLLKGKTFAGEKPTLLNEAANLTVPITLSNIDPSDPNVALQVASLIADGLGISANQFKEDAGSVVSKGKSIEKEINRLQKTGNKEGAKALKEKNKEAIKEGTKLESYQDAVKEVEKMIKEVKANTRLSTDQRKEKLLKLEDKLTKAKKKAEDKFRQIRGNQ